MRLLHLKTNDDCEIVATIHICADKKLCSVLRNAIKDDTHGGKTFPSVPFMFSWKTGKSGRIIERWKGIVILFRASALIKRKRVFAIAGTKIAVFFSEREREFTVWNREDIDSFTIAFESADRLLLRSHFEQVFWGDFLREICQRFLFWAQNIGVYLSHGINLWIW